MKRIVSPGHLNETKYATKFSKAYVVEGEVGDDPRWARSRAQPT